MPFYRESQGKPVEAVSHVLEHTHILSSLKIFYS
jgi:hypothetical protein